MSYVNKYNLAVKFIVEINGIPLIVILIKSNDNISEITWNDVLK